MDKVLLLGFLIWLATSGLATIEIKEEQYVLVLDNNNFDCALKQHDSLMVEFYAPWCGHCKMLAPEYAQAAKLLKNKQSEIRLGKVDATKEKDLATKYQVQGYPRLKFFVAGEVIEYQGGRTAKEIVQWVEKKCGPPALELKTNRDIEKIITANEAVAVGFFINEYGTELKNFLDVAEEIENVPFGYVTMNKALFDQYQIQKDNAVVIYKKFDDGRTLHLNGFSTQRIKVFILENSLPNLLDFTKSNIQQVMTDELGRPTIYIFKSSKDDDFQIEKKKIEIIISRFKSKFLFVLVDPDSKSVEQKLLDRIYSQIGVSRSDFPTVRCMRVDKKSNRKPRKYKPDIDKAIDEDSLVNFLKNITEQKVEQYYLAENVPSDWNKLSVKVLTGKNFHNITRKKNKDVLVEFYAPWCGHCKKLDPIWKQLASKYRMVKSLVFGKMDATANEVEGLEINGFPTIKLYKKDTNQIVDYDGDRTMADLTAFVEHYTDTSIPKHLKEEL